MHVHLRMKQILHKIVGYDNGRTASDICNYKILTYLATL